jgi:peptidoglycan/LPS O-acetylase OafA/YrhL
MNLHQERGSLSTDNQKEIRLKQLDGLRGLAALAVFFFHAIMMLPPNSPALAALTKPLLRPFWDGPSAVMLFFVLSGYVLTLPYTDPSPRRIDTIPFIIRRIARLYPAYWIVLLIALALKFFVFSPQGLYGLSEWVNSHWQLKITWLSLIKHFTMISPYLDPNEIDPVIWSLMIEMKISLIFPAILMLVQRTKHVRYAFLILGFTIVLSALIHGPLDTGSQWLHVLTMLPVFCLGSYLAKYRATSLHFLKKSTLIRAVLGSAGLILYGSAWFLPILNRGASRLATAVGSGIIVMLFLASISLEKLGTSRPILFLGDISYSFYLIHLPILLTITSFLYPLTGSVLFSAVVSLACSLLAAWIIFVTVEIPGHTWGKRVARSFNSRMSALAVRPAS